MFSWFELESTLLKLRTCVLMPNSSSWDRWFPSVLAQCSVTGSFDWVWNGQQLFPFQSWKQAASAHQSMWHWLASMVPALQWPHVQRPLQMSGAHMSNTLLFQGLAFKIAFLANQLPQEGKTHDCHRNHRIIENQNKWPQRTAPKKGQLTGSFSSVWI